MTGPVTDWSAVPVVLSVEEAAALLRLGRNAAYQAIADGTIPALRVGRRLLVSRDTLRSLLEAGAGDLLPPAPVPER
jgi:excisionase family DNA binding protein